MKQPNLILVAPVETFCIVKDRAYMLFNNEYGGGNFLCSSTHIGYTCHLPEGSAHLDGAAWIVKSVPEYWREKLGYV